MSDFRSAANESASTVPLVSAIVLCYNHERFVLEALESVRCQTYPRIQLIIVDDCSKDGSVRAIEQWIEKHRVQCVFLPHVKNRGICATLNHALEHARGKYVAAFAADDVWLPHKTEAQVSSLEQSSEKVGVAFSDAIQMDESGRDLPELFIAAHRPGLQVASGRIFDTLWELNFIPAMTTMIRRDSLQKAGGYDESLAYEDWDMWLRLALEYEFAYYRQPLARYRIVGTSMMRTMVPALVDSAKRIRIKMLERGVLDPAQRVEALDTLVSYGKERYYEGFPDSATWLWKAMRYKPGIVLLTFLAFTLFRIPASWIEMIHNRLKPSKSPAA